jgi:formylglycine-generating enzyme required for sulfatase activity
MRTLLLLALAALLCAACADEPAQDATSAEPTWRTQRPENAYPYTDETLQRFEKLLDRDGWRDWCNPAWTDKERMKAILDRCMESGPLEGGLPGHDFTWNAQGMLEAVHEKTGLVFVLIPAGEFLMGSPATELDRSDSETQHHVTIPALLLCTTECTQAAWDRTGGEDDRWSGGLDDIPPSIEGEDDQVGKGPEFPVDDVMWTEADSWCRKLGLRLPSEAEWEYGCRAGTTTPFSTGGTLTTEQANYNGDYPYAGSPKGDFRRRAVRAGSLPANPWGLHEMHGNVSEWCEDNFHSYDTTPRDGSACIERGSDLRVFRGGSLKNGARRCRSASRRWSTPEVRPHWFGFRPAADLPR